MKKMKAYIGWNDKNHTHYYKDFEIIEKLPEKKNVFDENGERIIKIESVKLDSEQGNEEVYKYDYYVATIEMDYGLETDWYFCIEKEEETYFTVTIKFNTYPTYPTYYLTHDIFYSNFDINESFQDDCLFDVKELEMVKDYLKKDSALYDYNYTINFED